MEFFTSIESFNQNKNHCHLTAPFLQHTNTQNGIFSSFSSLGKRVWGEENPQINSSPHRLLTHFFYPNPGTELTKPNRRNKLNKPNKPKKLKKPNNLF